MKDGTKFDANVLLAWGTEDESYLGCRLVQQNVVGQTQNPNKTPNDPPAYLVRVFEEISRNDRTQVGLANISFDQYGRKSVVLDYIQYFDGSGVYSDAVGSTAAPAPNAACILKTVDSTNDGTLIRTKLTFIDSGELADNTSLRFGGKVIERELVYLNEVPPTPSGYTYVGTSIEYVTGLPVYRAKFIAPAGGGTPGTGGVISQGFTDSQNGTVAFDPASPNTATGIVVCTTRYVSTLAVTSNPVTQPAGFVLFAVDYEDDTGLRMWITRSGFGSGLVLDESTISQSGALVVYHRISFGTAPTTPSATIGGTVTLFESSTINRDGCLQFDYKWAEGDGQSSIETQGEPDGAIVVQITTLTAAATTPSSPGAGYYLISLSQTPDGGYSRNRAVYKKPPVTVTFLKKINFTKPGSAVISGSPLQLVLNPPVTMDILAEVEVSYGTSQDSTAPFTVSAWATYYETYTPTDTGLEVASTKGLGGYLAGASGTSGTNSVFNGILCDSWEYQLGSSTPSSFTAAVHVLDVDNDPYLTATDGTVVYRRTVVSYDFS